jgi:hypothetical protein
MMSGVQLKELAHSVQLLGISGAIRRLPLYAC